MAENIMTHLVAGYPTLEASKAIAESLIKAGAGSLEIQFPYSDPMADGPVIQEACQKSLDGGFKRDDGFAMVAELSAKYDTPIYIMSYGGPVYAMGVKEYATKAKEAGAKGLIIPDLCIGQDEGLYAVGDELGIEIVPVMISGIEEKRMEEILSLNPSWVYLVLRRGITGTYTELDDGQISMLNKLAEGGVNIYVGFGIQQRKQVELLSPHTAGQIVGSRIVRAIQEALEKGSDPAIAAGDLLRELRGER